MQPTEQHRQFVIGAISSSRLIGEWLTELESKIQASIIAGKIPRHINEEEVCGMTYVAASLLLTMCGLLAEDDEEGKAMQQAARLLRAIGLEDDWQFSDHLHTAFEQILAAIGARKTKHLWN